MEPRKWTVELVPQISRLLNRIKKKTVDKLEKVNPIILLPTNLQHTKIPNQLGQIE